MIRRLLIMLGVLGAGATVAFSHSGPAVLMLVARVMIGWYCYLIRVIPAISVAWEGVATALFCLILFTLGLHRFLGWFHRESQRQKGTPESQCRPWALRRTRAIVLVVVVMFMAGIAATGIVHQVGWILRSGEPILSQEEASLFFSESSSPVPNSIGGLKNIGLAAQMQLDGTGSLPSTSVDSEGRRLHSWQTGLLPFQPLGALTIEMIDYAQPWNAPRNSALFRGIIPTYLNAEIQATRNAEGYALSHYAGNEHLLGKAKAFQAKDLTQGMANMILAGEVGRDFKPWGDPTNLRDPSRGIDPRIPNGFGNLSGSGANMLFVDGSVRFLDRRTNPKVLRSLSIPNEPGNPGHNLAGTVAPP